MALKSQTHRRAVFEKVTKIHKNSQEVTKKSPKFTKIHKNSQKVTKKSQKVTRSHKRSRRSFCLNRRRTAFPQRTAFSQPPSHRVFSLPNRRTTFSQTPSHRFFATVAAPLFNCRRFSQAATRHALVFTVFLKSQKSHKNSQKFTRSHKKVTKIHKKSQEFTKSHQNSQKVTKNGSAMGLALKCQRGGGTCSDSVGGADLGLFFNF